MSCGSSSREQRRSLADAGMRCITVDAFRVRLRVQCAGPALLESLPLAGRRGHRRAVCARLGSQHVPLVALREVVFTFPPSSLVLATVEKAFADLALCILLVPVAILAQQAPHLGKLLAA